MCMGEWEKGQAAVGGEGGRARRAARCVLRPVGVGGALPART